MGNKILKLLENTAGQLVFSLLSGCAYFVLIYNFVISHTKNGGGMIAFFFCPAIICGAALILIKLFKQCRENENNQGIVSLFLMHIVLMLIAVMTCIMMFV